MSAVRQKRTLQNDALAPFECQKSSSKRIVKQLHCTSEHQLTEKMPNQHDDGAGNTDDTPVGLA